MAVERWRWMILAVAIAAIGVVSVADTDGARSGTNLRATLTAELTPTPAAKVPRAEGLFVATLDGRTLSWRLTFNGLSGPPLVAHLHLGRPGGNGPVLVRLCGPCRSGLAGKATLENTTVAALRQQSAYLDLHTRKNKRGEIRGQIALGVVSALQIIAPKDGQTITPPTDVRFAVVGFELGADAGSIVAFVRGVADPVHVELDLTEKVGVASLPANKLLTGKRDLVFALARPDGTLLTNPEARATVYGLTIQGGRG
jgi:hypothetical protein